MRLTRCCRFFSLSFSFLSYVKILPIWSLETCRLKLARGLEKNLLEPGPVVCAFSVTIRYGGRHPFSVFNPLECRGNYITTANDMKLAHWPLMGGLLHLVQRGGDWVGRSPPPSGASSLYQMQQPTH